MKKRLRITVGIFLTCCTFLPVIAQGASDVCANHHSREKAEQGDAISQIDVAICYESENDTKQAISWYRKSAELGNHHAMEALMVKYLSGEGVPRNYNECYFWSILILADNGWRGAEDVRDFCESKLTPSSIEEVQERAAIYFEQF